MQASNAKIKVPKQIRHRDYSGSVIAGVNRAPTSTTSSFFHVFLYNNVILTPYKPLCYPLKPQIAWRVLFETETLSTRVLV